MIRIQYLIFELVKAGTWALTPILVLTLALVRKLVQRKGMSSAYGLLPHCSVIQVSCYHTMASRLKIFSLICLRSKSLESWGVQYFPFFDVIVRGIFGVTVSHMHVWRHTSGLTQWSVQSIETTVLTYALATCSC